MEEELKAVGCVLIAFVTSYFVVNQFTQLVLFIAWVAIGLLTLRAFRILAPKFATARPLVAMITSFALSAALVLFMTNLVKAFAFLALFALLTLILLRYVCPDVYEEIVREVRS